jgi:hypothetical protein
MPEIRAQAETVARAIGRAAERRRRPVRAAAVAVR